MKPTFEEREYELASNLELGRGGPFPRVFSSGQVLEKILGYDAAADVDSDHLIWKVLSLPRPKGVVLLPSYWPASADRLEGRLPSTAVSLILQYKRPERMIGSAAAQWRAWRQPFYRFAITPHQQTTLALVETTFAGQALVRYASPAFHTSQELDASRIALNVIGSSGFVSPSELVGHRSWTYVRPGVDGKANPDYRPAQFESIDLLTRALRQVATSKPDSLELVDRLGAVSGALRYRRPSFRGPLDEWLDDATGSLQLAPDALFQLRAYVTVQSALAQVGAMWLLVSP